MDIRTGFMTVFVVSGSVVILAHQIHKRLLSDFMKKIEFELGIWFYDQFHHHFIIIYTYTFLLKRGRYHGKDLYY
ncbi:hypothetical protein HanIR_Chr07g0328341 [Helianthus annuus]|nr:hypothetical protein HanIR_Chr07g0328341 [Helianthus annuus]